MLSAWRTRIHKAVINLLYILDRFSSSAVLLLRATELDADSRRPAIPSCRRPSGKDFKMNMSRLVASAIAASVALPALAVAGPAPMPSFMSEKCYGISAKASNDCGTASHSCAGSATKAGDPASWLYVPAGTCAKIVGGSLTPKG
jgi:uncharacterized membrane protein